MSHEDQGVAALPAADAANDAGVPMPSRGHVLNDLTSVLMKHYGYLPIDVRYRAVEAAVSIAESHQVCRGCGSHRVVVRGRKAYCTEAACDRRLPGPPCGRCKRPVAIHVCLSCSPDELNPGRGCLNCRDTGWSQNPCPVVEIAAQPPTSEASPQ